MLKKLSICLLLPLLMGSTLQAGELRQAGTHEHGVARLDLAQEGTQIDLHLESPAMNLLGYEHMPSSDADRQALEKTLAQLREADRLFRFNAQAQCRLMNAAISTPLAGESGTGAMSHDTHEEPGQDVDHVGDHEGHADIDADYRFECARPDELRRLSLDLFQLFPAMQRLLVQFVTDKRQGGAELTASNPELAL